MTTSWDWTWRSRNLVLAVLVGAGMYVQQKMSTPPAMDERQQSMNSTMMWMMPLMFTYFAISFPSGLAIYWFMSSVVSIVLQYVYVGSNQVTWRSLLSLKPATAKKAGIACGEAGHRGRTGRGRGHDGRLSR